jgi:imidazolonepropionase-like amidohydrolase
VTGKSLTRIGAGLLASSLALTTGLDGQGARPVVPLAITGATLINGTGAPPAPNQTIVIEGPRITAVGPADTVRIPANARTINAAGKFVIPGLIDGHTHWRGWTGELFLNHGVTSIIDLGNTTDWILAARDAEIGGAIRGPRIFTAAGGFDRRPSADSSTLPRVTPSTASYLSYVNGPASARAAVRALLVKGPDVIKIFGDLTPEELRALTEEAHKVDVPVIGHTNDVYAAVEGGMDGVTHLWGVSATLMTPDNQKKYREGTIASPYAWAEPDKIDALVAFMVKRGTSLNPSLINDLGGVVPQARQFEMADYELLMRPELRYVPLTATLTSLTFWHKLRNYSAALGPYPFIESTSPQVLEEFTRGYKNAQEFMRRFAKAGGRIVVGTDAAGSASVPGLSLHQELELLVDAGLTPMQALQAATRAPAEVIKKDYKLGTVTPKKLADLLILDADPLADIKNTRRINTVIKNGEVVDTRYHRDYSTHISEIDDVGVSSSTQPTPVVTEVISRTLNQMSQVIHDGSPFELIVRGNRFHSSSLVELNGRPLETTFVSLSELRAKVPTERIPVEGTYAVTVFTPWPGGGRSNVRALPVK